MRAALRVMKQAGEEGEEVETQSFPLTLHSAVVEEPFVQALILENEAMLLEITLLRRSCRGHAEACRQRAQAAETAARQLLAASEAEARLELCVAWQARLLGGLRATLEEAEGLRKENAALQQVMVNVQRKLGAPEAHSPPVVSEGDVTPARVITAVDCGSKLHAKYNVPLINRADSNSPRVPFCRSRKRGRDSGDGWLSSPAETTPAERGVGQQRT
ncbi:uncharacterized protein Tco025E_01712 [Trypanosoma conorhini]|uniref:Uncharacterized protein n=1 Tax=Trypanosoma conorhini TaxID=83891 RepID=A0A3R7NRU2_9TRYP|nr:uncharacterized protein Tco025E_01712 [Trypanosoma conorhini]RNF26083.1 hypothetical protein Tco025E_01712 [Trypanosoma conorhini]